LGAQFKIRQRFLPLLLNVSAPEERLYHLLACFILILSVLLEYVSRSEKYWGGRLACRKYRGGLRAIDLLNWLKELMHFWGTQVIRGKLYRLLCG
jgi:hypothetical protein